MHGLAGKELESRIDGCLDRLGGRELAGVPMRTMSKGMCQKVAVAQALLPRSGLLVLDEAWTGLDAEAKASLDDAIAERISGGGRVVFVDHEPGRLAHLHAERWRLEEAISTRVAELQETDRAVNAASTPTRPSTAAPTRAPTSARVPPAVEIEVSGRPGALADLTAALAAQPGVLSVRQDGERAFIRAQVDSSDAVLRRLLAAGEEAHVLRVGAEPEPGASPTAGGGRSVIALVRYQFALLIRSHRWIPPAVLFVAGVAGLASGGPALGHGVGLSQGFAWSALGLAAALVCLLVGSAIGALFNPPLIRRPAAAMLCTTGAVVLALAWSGSPANAEVRSVGYGAQEATWPTGLALFAAIALIAVAWAVSAQVAARRQA